MPPKARGRSRGGSQSQGDDFSELEHDIGVAEDVSAAQAMRSRSRSRTRSRTRSRSPAAGAARGRAPQLQPDPELEQQPERSSSPLWRSLSLLLGMTSPSSQTPAVRAVGKLMEAYDHNNNGQLDARELRPVGAALVEAVEARAQRAAAAAASEEAEASEARWPGPRGRAALGLLPLWVFVFALIFAPFNTLTDVPFYNGTEEKDMSVLHVCRAERVSWREAAAPAVMGWLIHAVLGIVLPGACVRCVAENMLLPCMRRRPTRVVVAVAVSAGFVVLFCAFKAVYWAPWRNWPKAKEPGESHCSSRGQRINGLSSLLGTARGVASDDVDNLVFFFTLAAQLYGDWIPGIADWLAAHIGSEFHKSGFGDRISFSLNIVDKASDGSIKLRMRTLADKALDDVYPDQYARESVVGPAKEKADTDGGHRDGVRTASPFICLVDSPEFEELDLGGQERVHRQLNDQLLNVFSSMFGVGFIADSLCGADAVANSEYVFGLTHEKRGTEMANQKYRCLLIRRDHLELLATVEEGGGCEYEGDAVGQGYARYRHGSLRKMWQHRQGGDDCWPLVKNLYICCPSSADALVAQ